MAHDAAKIANKFLELAEESGMTLTPMHVLKLVYIAHGWSLALRGLPLIENDIEAWQYGPVIPDLYHKIKVYGSGPIKEMLRTRDASDLETEEQSLIAAVFKAYKEFSAFKLSALTHAQGTPWFEVWNVEKGHFDKNLKIRNDKIKSHFSSLKPTRATT